MSTIVYGIFISGGGIMARTLGQALRAARKVRGLSLARVAGPAKITAAYVDKLEQDRVQEPSPHILYKLAVELRVRYEDLMRLAGYVVPASKQADPGRSVLATALDSEELTDDELTELAKYLSWYRSQRGKR
jgi:transcriptional regulator with XRE-family HTH domain